MGIGKMKKHREMLQHSVLRHHIPETLWFTHARALRMLRSYSTIFIKPNHGSGGNGIIRVNRVRNGYEVRCGLRRTRVGPASLYKTIQSYLQPSGQYLVQRGLRLARYKGSIFDARIYMQKPNKKWEISGMAARVAAPRRFITNYHKGGHGEQLNRVLSRLFKDRKKVNDTLRKITTISHHMARTINKRHAIRELGVDLGIEKNGRIWIIEANSKPGHMLFTQLPDKTPLHRIMKNKRLIRRRLMN